VSFIATHKRSKFEGNEVTKLIELRPTLPETALKESAKTLLVDRSEESNYEGEGQLDVVG
jgi:hypothetical protein